MSPTLIRNTMGVVTWALLAHPAGLVGQDTVSTPRPVAQVLSGNPTQAGRFVVRITFAAGSHTDPHHHGVDLTVRVLRGRHMLGWGARFDTTRVVPVEPGNSTVVKAGVNHFDWFRENGELEIEGEGPMETVMVDSTGKAIPVP